MKRPLNFSSCRSNCFSNAIVTLGALALMVTGCSDGAKDLEAPTITATVQPAANENGWHSFNPTVTFQCADEFSGIADCPGPILVEAEGEGQTVTGTATDRAGNTANASVIINLDKTAANLTVASPADGEILPDPDVSLVGTVDDVLSGVAAVSCDLNGTLDEAEITESINGTERVFACSFAVEPGTHIITVVSTDVAGNLTSSLHTVNHTPAPVVTIDSPNDGSLQLQSPVTVTGTIDDSSAAVTVNNVAAVIANERYSASVNLDNGVNDIAVVARNDAGSGVASIKVLAVTGLDPTVRITSPSSAFVMGGDVKAFTAPLSLTVTGWIRDNRLLPGTGSDVSVTVWFNNNPELATLTKEASGLCRLNNRCWTYTASREFPAPDAASVSIEVTASAGSNTTTRQVSGIVDFCYQNNSLGGADYPEACAASAFQIAGVQGTQSRRCIQNADGCSAPLGPLKNDPTIGLYGRISTAFGVNEDAGSEEGAYTVFGQPRQIQLPCNRHDECYHQACPVGGATRGAGVQEKKMCNDRFFSDMKAVCKAAYPEVVCPISRIGVLQCPLWRAEKNRCYAWAFTYYQAVGADALRYNFLSPYSNWPYNNFFTPCEDCPTVE